MVSLVRPSVGRITNPFGAKNPSSAALATHRGLDFGHGNGTTAELTVRSPISGYASLRVAKGAGTYGNHWYITDGNVTVILAHLASHIGGSRQVVAGEIVGVMGNTGTVYVHLHMELLVNSVRVDPEKYLSGAAAVAGVPVEVVMEPLEAEMKLIEQKSRGIAAVGAGYFKQLTEEEVPQAVKLWGATTKLDPSDVGAREFDLMRSVSVNGAGPAVSIPAFPKVDLAPVLEQVAVVKSAVDGVPAATALLFPAKLI